jgi:hypothetical protein
MKNRLIVLFAALLLGMQLACSLPFAVEQSAATSTPRVVKVPATAVPTESAAITPGDTPTAAVTIAPTVPGATATSASTLPRYTLRTNIASETISSANAATKAPDDILQTVSAPGGVGFEGPFCSKTYTKPTLEGPAQVEVFSRFNAVQACGWKPNEEVTITLTLPDGSSTTEKAKFDADMNGGVAHFIEPKIGDLLGKYTLQFEGTSGKLTTSVKVIPPSQPGLEKLGEGQFFLHGLAPLEVVRVFAYQPSSDGTTFILKGWRELKADGQGELVVENQILGSTIELVDAKGKIFTSSWGPPVPILRTTGEKDCSGAPVSQLKPGGHAVVNNQQKTPNNLRTKPDPKAPILGMINPGEGMAILDEAPVCAGGYLWWNVRTDKSGKTGWTAEGGDGDYWLVP